jgi:hypothetical protein
VRHKRPTTGPRGVDISKWPPLKYPHDSDVGMAFDELAATVQSCHSHCKLQYLHSIHIHVIHGLQWVFTPL